MVLVDSGTASAAEIVAGSLNRADRAILLGSKTHGKHSVQTPLPLGGKLGLLHMTTARFFFPSDAPEATSRPDEDTLPPSAGKPIKPHVFVLSDPNTLEKLQIIRRRAASRPLTPTTLPASRPAGGPRAALGRELIKNDHQLRAAIELLKKPAKIRATLQACAEARKKRATTQPSRPGASIAP